MITDLLKKTKKHKVKHVKGHSDIKSTYHYARNAITRKQVNDVM